MEGRKWIGSANGVTPERGGLDSLYCTVYHTVRDDQMRHVPPAIPTMMYFNINQTIRGW